MRLTYYNLSPALIVGFGCCLFLLFIPPIQTARCLSSIPHQHSGDPIIHTDRSWLHPNLESQNGLYSDLHTDTHHDNDSCFIRDHFNIERTHDQVDTARPAIHCEETKPSSNTETSVRSTSCSGDPIIHTRSSWLHPNLESQNALFADLYPDAH